ncbi:MAG: GAF domain-containing protein [bacterium]|nr:GAF domain-containing protein [bacterium]
MTDLHSYHQVLQKLLQFAVDYTGAERGLLLMVKPDRAALHPIASYNCDEQSVRELTEFSSTIPMASLEDTTPVFIDNACNDATTNCYHSVVTHNILSVACVPVVSAGEAVAVLYLDHHLIPALFGSDDRKLMGAIAGIMSVTILAARELRSMASQTVMLRESLLSHGTGPSLITGDSRMLRMLEKLPQVAASAAECLTAWRKRNWQRDTVRYAP